MIRISLGNVGSGKTVCEVREIFKNRTNRKTYSNIITDKISNNVSIDPSMIIGGDRKDKKTWYLNTDFWKDIGEPINVVIDEAHSILNSRRSMSKVNILMTDWIALIRRVIGTDSINYGELVLITQLPNRIDNITREMAHQIRYHICEWIISCKKCNTAWRENSEMPEPRYQCPRCKSTRLVKSNHIVHIWKFKGMEKYIHWKEYKLKSYYEKLIVTDIERYFRFYDTLQWDNMFSDLY